MHAQDLLWFGQAFLAQSLVLKAAHGWIPPNISDYPSRVLTLLADVLSLPQEEVGRLLGLLIDIWKRQAGELLSAFGHEVPW
jgi:hypothetical protein